MLNDQLNSEPGSERPFGEAVSEEEAQPAGGLESTPAYDESIIEELGALISDAGLYATAEIAFQKSRAKFAGRTIGAAVGFAALALVLLHIALIAMAVGMVIALAPLVTIWGAIAIVVGIMLLAAAILAYGAIGRARTVGEMFSSRGADGDKA